MLNIAGFEKTSLIDYPGKLSAVIFTHGCNMRCVYCHNPELVVDPIHRDRLYKPTEILNYLNKRKGKLDAVVITGGEPLLYDDLASFIIRIRKLGYLVKLDTNGLLPERLETYIRNNLLDCVSMDIKYVPDDYIKIIGKGGFEKIKNSIRIIMDSGIDYEFRTTYVKGIHNTDSSKEIASLILNAQRYFIQNFRPGKTIDPELSFENSFTEKELRILKKHAKLFVKNTEIR